jgi:predicted ferric reductase
MRRKRAERRRDRLRAAFWIGVFLIVVLGPLVLLIFDHPPAREFWREFAVALGFAGLSLMGLQFIPTSRLPFLGDTFPMDTLYRVHHLTSIVSFGLVLAHPLVLVLNNPNVLRLFDLTAAPWRARAGVIALLALVALVVVSIWRQELRIIYEPWHWSHTLLSIAAAGLAFWHIFGVGYHTGTVPQRVLWIAYGVVWSGMVVYVRLVQPAIQRAHPYEIVEVTEMRDAVWTLEIAPVGHSGFRFEPGQIAWLTINRSPFLIQEHPFSIASSAERRDTYKFTIKELGDFTSHINECVPGIRVYVDGPHGTFSLDRHPAPGYVFIGGGIGSVPLISMLRTMADRDDQRPVVFFYGNPSWEDVVFREELAELEKRMNLKVVHVLERPAEGWEGETGFITPEVLDRHLPAERDEWVTFICGPIPMIPFVTQGLRELGVPRSQIHSERYEMA